MVKNNKWLVKKESLNYTFDRRIFIGVLALIIIYFSIVLFAEGFYGGEYLSCPKTAFAGFCDNPMKEWCRDGDKHAVRLCGSHCDNQIPLCQQERITAGETLGELPGFWYRGFTTFVALVIGLGFVFNHLLHNRGVRVWSSD